MDIQGYFTEKGLALSAKLSAGAALAITRVVAGSGQTEKTASSLSRPRQTLAVNTPTHSGNTATIPVTLAASKASEDYSLTELGVYARDPEKGEILYKLYRLDAPVEIAAGSRMVLRFYLEETVSGEVNLSVACSPAGLLTENDLPPALERLSAVKKRELHVAKTGSDESGAGTEAAPYLTIQRAVDALPRYLSGPATITVHAGSYEEDVTVYGFAGLGQVTLSGAEGEHVQIKSVRVWTVQTPVELLNFAVTGERADNTGCSVMIGGATRVTLKDIVCTGAQSKSPGYGAIRVSYTHTVSAANVTVSNKQIAFDVFAGTLYLNNTDTGENNAVAIRCGSGWGSFGGFVQKGGAAVAGVEQTAYGGQIF